jgi:DNA-binding HxlR family transcriptional regulator
MSGFHPSFADLRTAALALLPAQAPGIGYRELHRQIGLWAPKTLRDTLGRLEAAGLVASEFGPARGNTAPARLYRRAG